MRKLIHPLLFSLFLAPLAAAEDNAADLFYKAFWLEQTAGDAAQAETLYRKIVDQHAKSPEAPRAILGLCRLRATRGESVDDLVELLESDHADAPELEQARAIATRLRTEFDPSLRPDDSALDRKLKGLYMAVIEGRTLSYQTKTFLADLGPVAHPMLGLVLRQTDHQPVQFAVEVLLMQRTEAAYKIVEDALADRKVLFKSAMVDSISKFTYPPRLLDSMARLYDSAPPHLRASIVKAAARAVKEPAAREKGFAILARAIRDDDQAVRRAASPGCPYPACSDAFAAGVIEAFEKDIRVYVPLNAVLSWLDRPELGPRIEKLLSNHEALQRLKPEPGPGVVRFARAVLAQLETGRANQRALSDQIEAAARHSGEAAAMLLDAALDRADPALARYVGRRFPRTPALDPLRRKALDLIYDDTKGEAAAYVLAAVPPEARHWDALVAALDVHKDKGLVEGMLTTSLLQEVGPKKAAGLAGYCVNREQYERLFSFGVYSFTGKKWTSPEPLRPFFAAVLPHVGPAVQGRVQQLTGLPELKPLVAEVLLAHAADEWGWSADRSRRKGGAPGPNLFRQVRDAFGHEPTRALLLERAADNRYEVGVLALKVARHVEGAEGTAALVRALDSRFEDVRDDALKALRDRGAPGADALVKFLARPGVHRDEQRVAFRSLTRCGGAAHGASVGAFLKQRPAGDKNAVQEAWTAYRVLAPEPAVELALVEVSGPGDEEYRGGALEVLTHTSDTRRLDVFRKILVGEIKGDVDRVLRTVAEQYLIELGDEALAHLRNPDMSIRTSARAAIESLKFYAEAKRAFATTEK